MKKVLETSLYGCNDSEMSAKTVSQYIGAITIIWVPKLCHYKWNKVMGAKTVSLVMGSSYGCKIFVAVYRCNKNIMGAKTVSL